MTLPWGYPGVSGVTVRLMSDGELRRLEVQRDLDQRRLTTEGGGPARPRHRRRLRAAAYRLRQAVGRARGGGLHARRQRDGHPPEPPGDLAHGVAARPRRARYARVEHGQGHLLGGDLAGRRPQHADPRRARHH
jgi:hypothetical protein